jgi:hypothetical protein
MLQNKIGPCRIPRLVCELLDEVGCHHGIVEDIDTIVVEAAAAETDQAEVDSIATVESGPDGAAVVLKARYLSEALEVINANRIELHVSDGGQPIWLCAAGESVTGALIMRLRS